MALNLKRKRGKENSSRGSKKRQLTPEAEHENGVQSVENSGSESEDVALPEDGHSALETNSPADASQAGEDGAEGEDDEWEGTGMSMDVDGEPHHERGGKPRKPPTGDEVRAIKEATDLFRSSSFKLQIDALLPNVRPKPSRMAPLDRFLLALHLCLSSLPSVDPQHPLEAARSLSNDEIPGKPPKSKSKSKGKMKASPPSTPISVPYPLPLPSEDANWKVAFEKPADVFLVGSWANKVSVKAKDGEPWSVDVAVEMPSSLFQEKDYLNGRFFHKKAYYLAVLARHIIDSNSGLNVDTFYESSCGDLRLTTLVLRPRQDGSQTDFTKLNAQVRIIPVLPASSPIPLARLSPHRSNFRVHHLTESDAPLPESTSESLPTPLYNTALLLSVTPKPHLLSVHALKQDIPSYADALALLRIWANQRGYGEGKKMCVRGFQGRGAWWSSLLEMVVNGEEPVVNAISKATRKRPLGKGLSSYQLFKAALSFLSRHDFAGERTFVKSREGHRFPPEMYTSHDGAVFVDSSSLINLLAGVPLASLDMLRHDAKITLEILDNNTVSNDPFPDVFLKESRDLLNQYDALIRVDISSAKMRYPSLHETLEHGSPSNALFNSIALLLRRGLGQRIKGLAILHPSLQPRPLSQAHPSNPSLIFIGLIFNAEHAFRLVDHGPTASEATSKAAEDFRNFWGDKAELRRFKDGSIVESVVWDVKSVDERAHIPAMVVRHILARHFNLHEDVVFTWQPAFDSVLRLPESILSLYRSAGMSAGFKGAMAAFDDLVKTLKSLDKDLPLSLLNVSPVSEYLRYTSAFNPAAVPASSSTSLPQCARYIPPMEIILEFEKSARWPDDLRAIQKMKLAFFERMAAALMNAVDDVRAQVVVGDGVTGSQIQDQSRLEIVTRQGWVFLARIWHDREATLLHRIVDGQLHVPKALQIPSEDPRKAQDREEATHALELYNRNSIHSPRHHRAIAVLCHRFSAYAGTVRLVKRWLAAHWLLHSQVGEEVVEILCASIFLGRGPTSNSGQVYESVPESRERGFAQVIGFLKDWKWADGIFVPLYGEAEGGLDPSTSAAPAGTKSVWTVSTEFDKGGHMWTSQGPDLIAAHRVRALAKATWDCLQGIETHVLDVKSLFIHPIDDYDFVIQLEQSVLPRYYQNIIVDPSAWARKGKFANLQLQNDEAGTPRPGFDPAQMFVDDLKRIYSDTLKIFYDPLGGDRIGAVWDPSLKQARPFRVFNNFSSIPTAKGRNEKGKDKDKGLVTLNESAVLSEIARLGAGLVKN